MDTWITPLCSCQHVHVKYVVQVMFGISVVVFSMGQLIRGTEDTAVYCSMLSGTLGLFLPAPGSSPGSALRDHKEPVTFPPALNEAPM